LPAPGPPLTQIIVQLEFVGSLTSLLYLQPILLLYFYNIRFIIHLINQTRYQFIIICHIFHPSLDIYSTLVIKSFIHIIYHHLNFFKLCNVNIALCYKLCHQLASSNDLISSISFLNYISYFLFNFLCFHYTSLFLIDTNYLSNHFLSLYLTWIFLSSS